MSADDAAQTLVGCSCGNVELVFPKDEAPLRRIWCCCFDCRQKCLWAQSIGGPALPSACISREKPMDLIYFQNKMVVTKGADKLDFFKLRDGANSTNMVSSCCKTTMLVDHPGYAGERVLLFPDIIRLRSDLTLAPPSDNLGGFQNDWPASDRSAALARLASLSKLASCKRDDPGLSGDVPDELRGKTTTFQAIEKSRGGFKIIGLEEGAEI